MGTTRSKRNWNNLTKEERATYMRLQMAHGGGGYGGGGYLPDDCSECPSCEQPTLGSGLCTYCLAEWRALDNKLRGLP